MKRNENYFVKAVVLTAALTAAALAGCVNPVDGPGPWSAWSAWNNIGTATEYLEKAEIEAGDFGAVVDNAGNSVTFDAEHEYSLREQERKRTRDNNGTETETQTRWTKASEREIEQDVEWGAWENVNAPTDYMLVSSIENGGYGDIMDTEGNLVTFDPNYEYQLQRQDRTRVVGGRTEKETRWIMVSEKQIGQDVEWGEWGNVNAPTDYMPVSSIENGGYGDITDTEGNLVTFNPNYEYQLQRQDRTRVVGGRTEKETRWIMVSEKQIGQDVEWGEWGNKGGPTGYLTVSAIEAGDYDNIVDTNGNSITLDAKFEYQLQRQDRTRVVGGKTETETRWTKISEKQVGQDITLSDKTPGVDDIRTVSILSSCSPLTGGGVIGMTNNNARDAIENGLLPPLSKQAAQLEAFFAESTGNAMFAEMADAEGAIKNKVSNTTPAAYLDLVNGHADSVAETLFTTAEAKTLWAGYRAGHYLLTRDWGTVGSGGDLASAKLEEYKAAYRAVNNGSDPYGESSTHTTVLPIGTNPHTALTKMEKALEEAGLTALGAQSIRGMQALQMVRALIRQFGQDNVEFQAFYDDLVADDRTVLLNYNYNADVGQATAMAPIELKR